MAGMFVVLAKKGREVCNFGSRTTLLRVPPDKTWGPGPRSRHCPLDLTVCTGTCRLPWKRRGSSLMPDAFGDV